MKKEEIKVKSQEQNFAVCERAKYRRYAQLTKIKYWILVTKLGWKASSAAKLFKIKPSTAKTILKKFRAEGCQEIPDWGPILEQKYGRKTPKQFKQSKQSLVSQVKKEEMVEEEETQFHPYFVFVIVFFYFGNFPALQ